MHAFLELCPLCKVEGVRVEFLYEAGYAATRTDPGVRPNASDIRCGSCGERLDDFEEMEGACLEAVRDETAYAEFPTI